jgi:hypothetical protein
MTVSRAARSNRIGFYEGRRFKNLTRNLILVGASTSQIAPKNFSCAPKFSREETSWITARCGPVDQTEIPGGLNCVRFGMTPLPCGESSGGRKIISCELLRPPMRARADRGVIELTGALGFQVSGSLPKWILAGADNKEVSAEFGLCRRRLSESFDLSAG